MNTALLAAMMAGGCPTPAVDVPKAGVRAPALVWRDPLATAEAHYERRALGAVGPTANPREIDAAIAAYRRAVLTCPGGIAPVNGLLRALFFRGAFTNASRDVQRRLFEEAKEVGEREIAILERQVPAGAGRSAAFKKVKGTAALYFWVSVSWGQWALASSKLAAVRQGAASRIRDLAQISVDLDPGYEQGSGYLLLGRLHDQTPRVIFLTFWISRAQALANLRRAYDMSPLNTVAQFFLAEAILAHDSSSAPKPRAF